MTGYGMTVAEVEYRRDRLAELGGRPVTLWTPRSRTEQAVGARQGRPAEAGKWLASRAQRHAGRHVQVRGVARRA